MEDTPRGYYDQVYKNMITKLDGVDYGSDLATNIVKNLETLSKSMPPEPEPEPDPVYVPTTRWEKFKAGFGNAWDNETTRTAIKAGGSFAGVVAVIYATIHRDHVIDKNAMSQANQQPR